MLAFSFHQELGASHLGNVEVIQNEISAIQNIYDNAFDSLCSQALICEAGCVWPGDADNTGRVDKQRRKINLTISSFKDTAKRFISSVLGL